MEAAVTCKQCGAKAILKSEDTDRYCSKCGTPLFVPIRELEKRVSVNDENWVDAYNSLYNYPELFSAEMQYLINRYSNWRYGITNAGRMLRGGTPKLDQLVILHKSFIRAGYVLRLLEEKSTERTLAAMTKNDLAELKKKGREVIENKDQNLLSQSWDVYPVKDPERFKAYTEKVLYSAIGVANGDLDKFLLLPKEKLEERFSSIVADLSSLLVRNGFPIESSSSNDVDDRVIDNVILGHSLRVAETLLSTDQHLLSRPS